MRHIDTKPLLKVVVATVVLLLSLVVFTKLVIDHGAMKTVYSSKRLESIAYLNMIEAICSTYDINEKETLLKQLVRTSEYTKRSYQVFVIDNSTRKPLYNLYEGDINIADMGVVNNIDSVYSHIGDNLEVVFLYDIHDNGEIAASRSVFKVVEELNWILGVKMDYQNAIDIAKIVRSRVWTNFFASLLIMSVILSFIIYVTYNEENKLLALNKKLDVSEKELRKALNRETIELERTKEHFIESEKMAVLGGLVGSFTHDISTPIGCSKTVLSDLLYRSKDLMKNIEENALKKSDLVDYCNISIGSLDIAEKNIDIAISQIDSFKRISVDQKSESIESVNIKTFFDQIVVGINPLFKDKKYRHNVNCTCEDIYFVTKPGCLSQVMLNLIVNSIKHGFKGREVGVIDTSVLCENNKLIIYYKDDGKGIPKELREDIWSAFFTTEKDSGGTGLGLFNVKNLIEEHLGGTIEHLDEEGFSVKIELPQLNKDLPL